MVDKQFLFAHRYASGEQMSIEERTNTKCGVKSYFKYSVSEENDKSKNKYNKK